uniref:TGS domain-containing protein n=1 Tax=Pseudictyota dubia TaxID=2749911 RepID=A0A7R9WDS6_9STRA|mmetsp:Transcript_43826/g.81506  ORF Transcript_43826/g.81506 Transcript_43826/m.81506 type:complete len:196 (+) Transcript_43826:3-590(+)
MWDAKEVEVINRVNFLTAKRMVYLANLSMRDYIRKSNKWLPIIAEWLKARGTGEPCIPVSVEFEQNISFCETPEAREAKEKELGARSVLPKVIKAGYRTLRLINFFTCGEDEVRAWSIREGTKAPQAAGVIHTDFEHGFICAEVQAYDDFKELGSEAAVRAAGKLRTEGRKYEVKDADIIFFKFNPSGGGGGKKK